MKQTFFPTIDPEATGQNIIRLRKQKGLTVKDLQNWFGFEEPRAIYKWQTGQSLPSIDNLYALSILLEIPMDHILVGTIYQVSTEPQAAACGSHYFLCLISISAYCSITRYFPSLLKATPRLSPRSSTHSSHVSLLHNLIPSALLAIRYCPSGLNMASL